MSNNKRARSSSFSSEDQLPKRSCVENTNNTNLLSELSEVLNTIKSTPSSGEISAEVMETFKILMLEIDKLSADESNAEARRMKQESELCLESWFDDLLARCEAEGELNLEDIESLCQSDDEGDFAFALVKQDAEDAEEEEVEAEEELIIVDDEGSEVGASQALAVL